MSARHGIAMRRVNKDNGFTLVSVLLYICLTTTLLLALSLIAYQLFLAQSMSRSQMEVAYAQQYVHMHLSQIFSTAEVVEYPSTGVEGDELRIRLSGGDVVRIFVLDGQLLQQVEAEAPFTLHTTGVQWSGVTFAAVPVASALPAIRFTGYVSTTDASSGMYRMGGATTTITLFPYLYE